MEVAVGICIAIGVVLAIWLYFISGMVLKLIKTTAAIIRKIDSDDSNEEKVQEFIQKARKRLKKSMSEEEAQKVLEELMKESGLEGKVQAIKMKGKK